MENLIWGALGGSGVTIIILGAMNLLHKREKITQTQPPAVNPTPTMEWDLTDDEVAQLKGLWQYQWADKSLLEQTEKLMVQHNNELKAWWDSVKIRLDVPVEYTNKLIANHETKKVWTNINLS